MLVSSTFRCVEVGCICICVTFLQKMTLHHGFLENNFKGTLIFFKSTDFFLAEPGNEIEITTSKLTMMCLKY